MTLTQIIQKIRSLFYTKTEVDSMGGGTSLDTTIKAKANDSNVVHKSGDESISGYKTFNYSIISTTESGAPILKNSHMQMWGLSDAILLRQFGDSGNLIDFVVYKQGIVTLPNGSLGTPTSKWADVNTVLLNGKTPAYDADVVHKTGDETISGNKTFNGNLVANNGKDGAFNTKANSSGSTSIQSLASDGTSGAYLHLCNKNDANEFWKGAFRLSTSKNGTDLSGFTNGSLQWCGKNVALDDNVVHKSGDETIGGLKTFSSNIKLADTGSVILGKSIRLQGGNDWDNGGRITINPKTTNESIILQAFNNKGNSAYIFTNGSVYPYMGGRDNLGTSTNKWKTINGIDPGALSLPNYYQIVTVDTTQWHDGDNAYTAPYDCWFCLRLHTGSFAIRINNIQITQNYSTDYAAEMIPLKKGNQIIITLSSDYQILVCCIFSCFGNV